MGNREVEIKKRGSHYNIRITNYVNKEIERFESTTYPNIPEMLIKEAHKLGIMPIMDGLSSEEEGQIQSALEIRAATA
jgi:hypothetical protein|tara:strand:+ start:183 stop:416 length:234 start_codon:yes stop_codon:yes gene_type:complete